MSRADFWSWSWHPLCVEHVRVEIVENVKVELIVINIIDALLHLYLQFRSRGGR